MKEYTDITVLLDRSGSMAHIKRSMESAFNKFIDEHKANEATRVTLIEFDDINDQHIVYSNVPVQSVEHLKLVPRGNTPLIDAFVQAIDNTGKRLRDISAADRPDQVIMVVITDGQENSSRIYKRPDVARRVNHQRDAYNWQFIYLGANQDAFAEAASFGIGHQHTLNYAHTSVGSTAAMAALASNTAEYAGTKGLLRSTTKSVKAFDENQRKQAGQ